jgi:glutamate-1-semialdehyde 2,1-aminomutase
MIPMTLLDQYRTTFAESAKRFESAKALIPTGVTHDTRMMEPFPVYITHAKGSRKWSLEGRELIDYYVGHGSLLLGHSPDAIVTAVQQQMARGTHHGSCHEAEIEWARQVNRLMPSAERVRFTGSGTEATLMALRLARLVTGKPKVLKFLGHFHGWHDVAMIGTDPPYDTTAVPGVPEGMARAAVTVPPNDLNAVEAALMSDAEIGCVILEPTGGHWGAVPLRGEFLRGLRDLCTKHGKVLIFDEVITGFRVSPGGAQSHYGVTPDLTTLAKILAGGLPGGALVGKAAILNYLEPSATRPKMKHPGTYNANPLSAAAGIAMLNAVATGTPCDIANAIAAKLRRGLNALFEKRNWPWVAYGDFSMVRVVPHYTGPRPDNDSFIPYGNDLNKLDGPKDAKFIYKLRQALLLEGVDWWGFAAMTSAAHTDADVVQTLTAFERAIPIVE